MKMDWGKGIALVLAVFVIATLSVVSYIISWDFYLVNNNHYEEGVEYQETIDSKLRADSLEHHVVMIFDDEREAIKVIFPEEVLEQAEEGKLNLYRPNNPDLDMNMAIDFTQGATHVIPMARMEKGQWKLTVTWTMHEKEYMVEEVVII